jgi:hypothetical protein
VEHLESANRRHLQGASALTTTKLERPLKRELEIAGVPYIVTVTPDGMTLVLKGKRKGFELNWDALISGDAAIATALNASLTANLTANKLPLTTSAPAIKKPAGKRRAPNRRSNRKGGDRS